MRILLLLFILLGFCINSLGQTKKAKKTDLPSNKSSTIENSFLADTYVGTIGNKPFKLVIEKIDGETIIGYNVTGNNKRAIKGRIVNKRNVRFELGGYFTVFKVILSEPGDEKWDGVFKIELWISDVGRHGNGSWKSNNGKLNRKIIIKDELNN